MSPEYLVRLSEGHLLRHAPAQSAQGRDAAVIDIAQDLLLRHLHDAGVLTLVAFKGGTALRKVYAGAAGRFSTDLDFSVSSLDDNPTSVLELLLGAIDGTTLPPFTYAIEHRRGRYAIVCRSDLGPSPAGPLRSEIDVGPPPWLAPTERTWVAVPIHDRYGGPLPALPVVDLAENVAEKIARLNRRSLARDAYDLVWLATRPGFNVDRDLVRRLVTLKAWVDLNGLRTEHASWAAPYRLRVRSTRRDGSHRGRPKTSTTRRSACSPCHRPTSPISVRNLSRTLRRFVSRSFVRHFRSSAC